jgi:phosphatidate cytidylyltransferase
VIDLFKRFNTSVVFGFVFFGSYWWSLNLFVWVVRAIFSYILLCEWPQLMKPLSLKAWLPLTLFMIVIPSIILTVPSFLNVRPVAIILYPFLMAWTFDVSAYFVGNFFGRYLIAPEISPSKTWAGLIGGILGIILISHTFVTTEPVYYFRLIALALLAFFGDLSISFLKRKAGIKDTGSILPGHGGLLDRMDSLIFVSYFALFRIIYWL